MEQPPEPGREREPTDGALYRLLNELDRLEEVLETMDELGLATRTDVERRMAELNARVDELSGE